MDRPASMTAFRISALDYQLEQGFSGSLNIKPNVSVAIPEDLDKAPLICRYRLQVIGEGDKEFRFNITGDGYFQIAPEQQAAVREKERAAIAPVFREMEQQMLKTIREITDTFHIKPIPLEVDGPEPDGQE